MLREVGQLFVPAPVSQQLRGMLERGEHHRPTQQVEEDEGPQQAKTGIVFIQMKGEATAFADISSTWHDLIANRKWQEQANMHSH